MTIKSSMSKYVVRPNKFVLQCALTKIKKTTKTRNNLQKKKIIFQITSTQLQQYYISIYRTVSPHYKSHRIDIHHIE